MFTHSSECQKNDEHIIKSLLSQTLFESYFLSPQGFLSFKAAAA